VIIVETLHIVINEGDVVFATADAEEAEAMRDKLIAEHIADEVEDAGRDIDDLTEEEYSEFAFMAGFNGGHHYTAEVSISRDNPDAEITTAEGDTISVEDIFEVYDEQNSDISANFDEVLEDL
jgi:hypothetical protein